MSNDLDGRLRNALRPVDPGERFTRDVLERIANEPATPMRRPMGPALRWLAAAAAASIIVGGVLIDRQWHTQQRQRGALARQQLLEALRVTSNKLDIAYRAVNEKDTDGTGGDDAGPAS